MPVEYDHKSLAQFLHRTGHFWRPDNPDCHNVTADNVVKLRDNSRLLKMAVASHQAMDATYNDLALSVHSRSIIPDGDVGPVTLQMQKVERCPIPDWDMPSGAATMMPIFSDDPDVQLDLSLITLSMRDNPVKTTNDMMATGSGSWPIPGCNPKRPNRENEHSTRIHIDTTRATSSQRSSMVEECALVAASEAEFGQHVEHIIDYPFASGESPSDIAEHDVRYENIAGSTIGYAYFPQPGTCNQTMKCRLDNNYDRTVLENAALKQHEYKGHSDGLRHTNGGRMNPSLRKPAGGVLTWKGDPHERTKARYFGGVPIEDTDDPDDPSIPKIKIVDGEFAVAAFGQLARLKVEPIDLQPTSIDPSSIVIQDKKIDFDIVINGTAQRIQLQIIERADF